MGKDKKAAPAADFFTAKKAADKAKPAAAKEAVKEAAKQKK